MTLKNQNVHVVLSVYYTIHGESVVQFVFATEHSVTVKNFLMPLRCQFFVALS